MSKVKISVIMAMVFVTAIIIAVITAGCATEITADTAVETTETAIEAETTAVTIAAETTESKPNIQVIDIYMGEVKAFGLDSLESVIPGDPEEVLVAEFHVWVPNVIVVFKGDTVQLNVTNPRSGVHSLEIADFNINTGEIAPKGGTATVEFTADKAGAFTFKCDTPWDPDEEPRDCDADHEFMTGTLIVLER